ERRPRVASTITPRTVSGSSSGRASTTRSRLAGTCATARSRSANRRSKAVRPSTAISVGVTIRSTSSSKTSTGSSTRLSVLRYAVTKRPVSSPRFGFVCRTNAAGSPSDKVPVTAWNRKCPSAICERSR
ncbi:MAG: hypothetical protein AVDCRST_MAG79-2888, partial [uncultured Thermoleophilia bacterium]